MDLQVILSSRHDQQTKDEIVAWVVAEPSRLEELMSYFFSDNLMICQRASWPVGWLGDRHPEWFLPYLPQMLDAAREPKHEAVRRCVVRTLELMDIPADYVGQVYDFSFTLISDPKVPIAARSFAMGVCTKIAMIHPDLAGELIELLEDISIESSPGILSKRRRSLAKLGNLQD